MGNKFCCKRRKPRLSYLEELDEQADPSSTTDRDRPRKKTISFKELPVQRRQDLAAKDTLFETIRQVGIEEFYEALARSCELFEDLFLLNTDVHQITGFDFGTLKKIQGCQFFLLDGGSHRNPQAYVEGNCLEFLRPERGWPSKAVPVCLLLSQENLRYILKGHVFEGRLHGKNIVQVTIKESPSIQGQVVQIYRNHFKWNHRLAIQQEWVADDIGSRVIEKYKPQIGFGTRLEIFYKPNQFDLDSEEEEDMPPGARGATEPENGDEQKVRVWRSFLMTNLFLRDVESNRYTRLTIHRDYLQNQAKCFGTKNSDIRRDKNGIVEYKTYSLNEIKKREAVQQTPDFCSELRGASTTSLVNGKVSIVVNPEHRMRI